MHHWERDTKFISANILNKHGNDDNNEDDDVDNDDDDDGSLTINLYWETASEIWLRRITSPQEAIILELEARRREHTNILTGSWLWSVTSARREEAAEPQVNNTSR